MLVPSQRYLQNYLNFAGMQALSKKNNSAATLQGQWLPKYNETKEHNSSGTDTSHAEFVFDLFSLL